MRETWSPAAVSYVVMSSLPSEAEARKILADKRSGQAVMDDYLKSQAASGVLL